MVEHIKMAGTEFQTSNFMKLNHHKAFLLSVISEMFESKTPPPPFLSGNTFYSLAILDCPISVMVLLEYAVGLPIILSTSDILNFMVFWYVCLVC